MRPAHRGLRALFAVAAVVVGGTLLTGVLLLVVAIQARPVARSDDAHA